MQIESKNIYIIISSCLLLLISACNNGRGGNKWGGNESYVIVSVIIGDCNHLEPSDIYEINEALKSEGWKDVLNYNYRFKKNKFKGKRAKLRKEKGYIQCDFNIYNGELYIEYMISDPESKLSWKYLDLEDRESSYTFNQFLIIIERHCRNLENSTTKKRYGTYPL